MSLQSGLALLEKLENIHQKKEDLNLKVLQQNQLKLHENGVENFGLVKAVLMVAVLLEIVEMELNVTELVHQMQSQLPILV